MAHEPGDREVDRPDLSTEEPHNKRIRIEPDDGMEAMFVGLAETFMSQKASLIQKRAQDKELSWDEIPSKDRPTFWDAMKAHWKEWLDFGSVEILSKGETDRVRRTTDRRRILKSRWALRDKSASSRTAQNRLALKAKARLCIGGHNCPDAQSGQLKTDAPTVQRTSVLVFLQVAANLGWLPSLATGDISSAFLQGKPRNVADPIYMEQPRGHKLPGVEDASCLIKVVKGVFGLPDAPRAWWEEFSGTLLKEFGMEKHSLDQAFFVKRRESRLQLMILVHVDDILVAHDGSSEMLDLVAKLRKRYPFGDWKVAADGPLTYTGKVIEVVTNDGKQEALVHQKPFIQGRLEPMALEKKGRELEDLVSVTETSEFKSMCGSLAWIAGLTRPDIAHTVNMLQKRQCAPRYRDCKRAIDLIKEIKASEDVAIRIRPIHGEPCVVAWTDSALYNSYDETGIKDDAQLRVLEKQLVRSQHGVLVALVAKEALDSTKAAVVSPLDWVSHASRRVVTSTFAAETGAAIEAVGRAVYVRAMLAEIMHGKVKGPHEWSEDQVPMRIMTDCKSLYDNIAKDCSLCDDRNTALYIASLRQQVSAGPQRDMRLAGMSWVPSRHQLADGLTKAGLSDTLRNVLRTGTALFHEESAQALKRKAVMHSMTDGSSDGSATSEW